MDFSNTAKRKKIVLCGHFGENNYGDIALLVSSLNLLQSYNITILTGSIENTRRILLQHKLGVNICLIYSGRWGLFDKGKKGLSRLSWIPITIKELRQGEIVLLGPGSLLQDQTSLPFLLFWFVKAFLAILLCRRFAFWGVGVGEVKRKLSRYIIRFMAKFASFIIARDERSFSILTSEFGSKRKNTFFVPDFALLYDYKNSEVRFNLARSGAPLFGVNFRYLTEKHFSLNATKRIETYISSVKELLLHIQKAYPTAFIYFIPMCSQDQQDDRKMYRELRSRYKHKIDCTRFILADHMTVAQTKHLMSKLDCFIGTRLHSIVFSTSEIVPTLGISYAPKVEYYLGMIDMGEFAIDIKTINGRKLVQKFEELYDARDKVRSVLKEQIKTAQSRIYLTEKILGTYI